MMGPERMPRVDDALRQVIGEVVTTELKDPRIGFVTVTGVQTSPDLRSARVYVSILDIDNDPQEALDGLDAAHGFIQRRLAEQLRIKHTPKLHFLIDDTVSQATHIEELIDQQKSKEGEATEDLIVDVILSNDSYVLITHENMDGDALGSLFAMDGILRALGKDSIMLVGEDEIPVPPELQFFDLSSVQHTIPSDVAGRVAIFLDCGNIDRSPFAAVAEQALSSVNIDHHHDNTCFAKINHIVGHASCTAELVWRLMRRLEVEPQLPVAEALYIGLVTDTGRFMYQNTGVDAHVMAAELIAVGVDVPAVYRRLFEDNPIAKLRLLARGIQNTVQLDQGRFIYSVLRREDFDAADASDSFYEGVIDHLRAVEGASVAALIRELPGEHDPIRKKVSLRSADGEIDVSVIARSVGGGGHRQAAGLSTELPEDELIELIRDQIAAQLYS